MIRITRGNFFGVVICLILFLCIITVGCTYSPQSENIYSNISQIDNELLSVISTDPKAPAILRVENKLNVNIYYNVCKYDAVQVWARPYKDGELVRGYRAHQIINLSKKNNENGLVVGWFYFKKPAQIDEIRIKMRNAKTKEMIKIISYPVDIRWVDANMKNI